MTSVLYLSISVLSFCLPISLSKHSSLEELQFIIGQSVSQGAKEAMIVSCVVDHEQDSSQQFIGHKQVVQIRPLVVLAAVAATPLNQGPEIILVSVRKFKKSPSRNYEQTPSIQTKCLTNI